MSEEKSVRDLRLEKLARLREMGQDPYSVERFERTADAQTLLNDYDFDKPEGERPVVRFAGRIVSYRLMGKAGFAHISDGDAKIQAYFKLGDCRVGVPPTTDSADSPSSEGGRRDADPTADGWEVYNLLDIGDHIGVVGELFLTKTGEKTIHARELTPLSKSLQVLPLGKEKEGHHWYGLTDTEQRYRHRHLDLICNPEARQMLVQRMKIVSAVRRFFLERGYLESETPMLQLVAGGAAARPFTTHYNAYDMDVKLRISLELYLKRLICGDLPKVFEIGRVFRNEGVSNRHNPEFSLLEWYEAYANLEDVMTTVEELFRFVAREVFGSEKLMRQLDTEGVDAMGILPEKYHYYLKELAFGKTWHRVNLLEEIERHTGLAADDLTDLDQAKAALRKGDFHRSDASDKSDVSDKKLDLDKEHSLGGLIEKLLEVFVEPTLQEPTFVMGYPIETSPLAKKDPKNPRMTRRFEGYILGKEVCNAFSEINDPVDQRERFEQQARELAKGDDEAHPMDDEFVHALEAGMPPTGGCGIGMDRMAMILTGAEHLREILLFPMMKPEKDS